MMLEGLYVQVHLDRNCTNLIILERGTPVWEKEALWDSKMLLEGVARIGDDDTHRLSQHKLHVGDIVYGRRGDIGRRGGISN